MLAGRIQNVFHVWCNKFGQNGNGGSDVGRIKSKKGWMSAETPNQYHPSSVYCSFESF